MVFNSLEFIFIFLTLFLIVYTFTPDSLKNHTLSIGSLLFYAYGVWNTPLYFFLFLMIAAVTFIIGQYMGASRKFQRFWLRLGVVFLVLWLVFFKYTSFLLENIGRLLPNVRFPGTKWILPLGISFYIFQSISYLADIYRGKIRAERSFVRFCVYLAMFPQLIMGPIVTYDKVAEELRTRRYSLQGFNQGIRQFTIGLWMKVILADSIGGLWSDITSIGFESISTPLAWMGIFAYSFQLYFDFCGYSIMAVGLGKILGFELPMNFDHPYMAVTMTEFWRKWHITLGSWFREYIYIPLGGNRRGTLRTIRNLLVVWLLTGLWHGAAWNFVLWGLFLFVLIILEKYVIGEFLNQHRFIGHVYMIFMIPLSWLIFAVTDISSIVTYLQRLFPIFEGAGQGAVRAGDYMIYGKIYGAFFLLAIVFSTKIPAILYKKFRYSYMTTVVLLFFFWLSVYRMYQGMNDPFLYFRF